MTDDSWIVIPNWEQFQHYSDREPIWIKLYIELRNRDDWRQLTYAERGLLVSIWLEYTAANGQLRRSAIAGLTGQDTRNQQVMSLNHAGFIEVCASKPLALRARGRALARERARDRTPQPPAQRGALDTSKRKSRSPHVTGYRMVKGSHGVSYVPDPFGIDKPPYPVPRSNE